MFTNYRNKFHIHQVIQVCQQTINHLKETSYSSFFNQLAFSLQSVQSSNSVQNRKHFFIRIPNMKLVAVAVYLVVYLTLGVNSASKQLTLNGNAHIQFFGPRDEIWNGLSHGKNLFFESPIIELPS